MRYKATTSTKGKSGTSLNIRIFFGIFCRNTSGTTKWRWNLEDGTLKELQKCLVQDSLFCKDNSHDWNELLASGCSTYTREFFFLGRQIYTLGVLREYLANFKFLRFLHPPTFVFCCTVAVAKGLPCASIYFLPCNLPVWVYLCFTLELTCLRYLPPFPPFRKCAIWSFFVVAGETKTW